MLVSGGPVREVPAEVASRPFDKSHQVPQCESDAYAWAMKQPDGTYEALDTKLARSAKPAYILQLLFYNEQLARIQGAAPRLMHVELGPYHVSDIEFSCAFDVDSNKVGLDLADAMKAELETAVPRPVSPVQRWVAPREALRLLEQLRCDAVQEKKSGRSLAW